MRRLWLAWTLASALVLLLLLTPTAAQALSWRLPTRAPSPTSRPAKGVALQQLQEVPPPDWVQRMQAALEERDPQVRILAPAAETLLPDGPWTLRLQVSDWPLVDAGRLGLGPHLVVQLDGQPPRPVVTTEVEMPALSAGSHLLTVYAAKPWGEAHKSPAALQQIRLHRLAPNPATLPPPGTPQLLPVSPEGPSGASPLLLDWLLINAPLQGLRTEGLGWRLRITLNGESVLLDRQIPLWLKGWHPGSNALLLELLDGRGEPLNAPFNSLLREVILPAAGSADRSSSSGLTALELAVLLGDQPLELLQPAPAPVNAPQEGSIPAAPPPPPPPPAEPAASPSLPEANPASEPPAKTPAKDKEEAEQAEKQEVEDKDKDKDKDVEAEDVEAKDEEPSAALVLDGATAAGSPADERAGRVEPGFPPNGGSDSMNERNPENLMAPQSSSAPGPSPSAVPSDLAPPSPASEQALSGQEPFPQPLRAKDSMPARAEVNPDGTLKRPPKRSPLEQLRERFKR